MKEENKISRKRMVELLNEDLAREYQAVISYIIYSQTIKGAEFNHIAQELEKHAGEELQLRAHAFFLEEGRNFYWSYSERAFFPGNERLDGNFRCA